MNNRLIDECFPALPDDFGRRGNGFQPYANRVSKAKQFALRYASVFGLGLAIIGFVV